MPAHADIARAQKLRLERVLLGTGAYSCALLITLGCSWAGFLDWQRALQAAAGYVVLGLAFIFAVVSGLNLRLRDPSMTALQVGLSVFPSVFAMYHVENAQLRTAFLMTAVVGMIFGAFRFDLRRLLPLCAWMLTTYLLLLWAIVSWSSEQLVWQVEVIIFLTYAMVLLLMASLGSHIRGLRVALKQRNRDLEQAMHDLHELATRDPLTRLPNRRALMDHAVKEVARAERRTEKAWPLCLCLLDIDWFKRINDTYGHHVGDVVLTAVADTLQKTMRTGDFVGRFGGEEFLVLLPETGETGGMRAAERICARVQTISGPQLAAGEKITVSIGVAIHQPGESAEQTLARADAALYRAKHRGRNRAELALPAVVGVGA